jgi:biopolymer transport protein ExbD
MKIRNTEHRETIVLQMTPMIDIVFQLLVFFVFTFKIVLPEGDFNIRMPAASTSTQSDPSILPLLKVRLRASAEGELAGLLLGDQPIEPSGNKSRFKVLQEQIRGMIGDSGGPGPSEQEVEIEADYNLRYHYAMNAITAITGYVDEKTKERHKLVEKVRFAPLPER